MKASLDFNLPEESREHLEAIHANEAWRTLSNLDYKLRTIVKHGHNYEKVEDLAKELRDEINETLSLVDI
jgi:hypothetical protein